MLAVAKHASTTEIDILRGVMAGPPSRFKPAAPLLNIREAWRTVQVRQLFRLSLEALFYWILADLEDGPKSTDGLVDSFLKQLQSPKKYSSARKWLEAALPAGTGPTELMTEIS